MQGVPTQPPYAPAGGAYHGLPPPGEAPPREDVQAYTAWYWHFMDYYYPQEAARMRQAMVQPAYGAPGYFGAPAPSYYPGYPPGQADFGRPPPGAPGPLSQPSTPGTPAPAPPPGPPPAPAGPAPTSLAPRPNGVVSRQGQTQWQEATVSRPNPSSKGGQWAWAKSAPASSSASPASASASDPAQAVRAAAEAAARRIGISMGQPSGLPTHVRPQIPASQSAAPAYTAVGASALSQGQPSPSEFPPAIKNWVRRSFAAAEKLGTAEMARMQHALKTVITGAQKRGEVWQIDWDMQPIPLISEQQAPQPQQRVYFEQHSRETSLGEAGTPRGGVRRVREEPWSDDDSPAVERQAKRQARFGEPINLTMQSNKGKGKGKKNKGQKAKTLVLGPPVAMDDLPRWHDAAPDAPPRVRVVGTCTALEKSYFRLVDTPDPSTVRPPAVLAQALARLQRRLDAGEVDYFYACDQFKAMRQDAQVQNVRSELTARIYECHGRAALDYGDMGEFNQCQTQLAALYAEGVPGSTAEFTAYRILYASLHRDKEGYALLRLLKSVLSSPLASDAGIQWCLRARQAIFQNGYRALFRLLKTAPWKCAKLLSVRVEQLRVDALRAMCACYRPHISAAFVATQLGFAPEARGDAGAEKACVAFLSTHGGIVRAVKEGGAEVPALDTRASQGKLFIPKRDMVSHGDANLQIDAFLAAIPG